MKKLFLSILLCLAFTISAFSFQKVTCVLDDFASATEGLEETPALSEEDEISIFIRNPSHSVFFNNKLYFIDETDHLLKVYDKETDAFLSSYIDLSTYSIVETTFLEGNLYLMTTTTEKNHILKVDLENFELIELNIEAQNTTDYAYETFYAQKITFDEKDYTLFTISGFRLNPILALLDNESGEVTNKFSLTFKENLFSGFESDLTKVLSYQQTNGRAYIIFIYSKSIAYYPVTSLSSITDLDNNAIQSLSHTNIPLENARLASDETITNVDFVSVNQKDYIAIFYNPKEDVGDFIRLYSFDFENGIETITYSAEFSCKNSEYAVVSENYFAFPDAENQEIFFHNIVEITDTEGTRLFVYSDVADNPEYSINFYNFDLETDNKEYYKTTLKTTELFSDPWGAKSDIIIDSGTDVLKIGDVILEHDVEVKDYTYCMFSYAGKNHCGFIKSSDIQNKTEILLSEAGYKPRVKVWPGTKLYSLPTNIASGLISISTTLNSKFIMEIEDNHEVEVLDVISAYVANGSRMIKVKVNGTNIGYIEEKCIHNPANVIEFVITNATIQKDNTKVYHSASKDSSTLTFTLSAGKNVRINGKRNTTTGWTSITFNDEYGNEFTGFIETDYIKADAWSTLQIVGCVLIAVNIGLLILILLYKKNYLGSHGQKISTDASHKENNTK